MNEVLLLYSFMLVKNQERKKILQNCLLNRIPEILCFIHLTNTINLNTLRQKIIYIPVYIIFSLIEKGYPFL